jgi:hypothetical protein
MKNPNIDKMDTYNDTIQVINHKFIIELKTQFQKKIISISPLLGILHKSTSI